MIWNTPITGLSQAHPSPWSQRGRSVQRRPGRWLDQCCYLEPWLKQHRPLGGKNTRENDGKWNCQLGGNGKKCVSAHSSCLGRLYRSTTFKLWQLHVTYTVAVDCALHPSRHRLHSKQAKILRSWRISCRKPFYAGPGDHVFWTSGHLTALTPSKFQLEAWVRISMHFHAKTCKHTK